MELRPAQGSVRRLVEPNAFGLSAMDNITACDESDVYTTAQLTYRIYIMPLVIVLGLCANVINVKIFSTLTMRQSLINWFLLGLSISDFCLLTATFFMFSLTAIAEKSRMLVLQETALRAMRWTYPIGSVVQTFNVYMTVLASLHKYVGVCHPFKAQQLHSSRQVVCCILSALGFALVANVTRWLDMKLVRCDSALHALQSIQLQPTALLLNENYFLVYRVIFYSILMFFLPFGTLIIVNTQMIRTLWQSKARRRQMASGCNSAEQKERSMTIMLVAVVAMFLFCNFLAFINNIVEIVYHYNLRHPPPFFTHMVEMGNLLVALNSAATIVVYLTFSRKYRDLFCLFICRTDMRRESRASVNGERLEMLKIRSATVKARQCTNSSTALLTRVSGDIVQTSYEI